MRIDRLSVERFGHFERLDLDLGRGLTLLHGPNEAGKSTLLAALRSLFYGIDERTPLAFRFDYRAISLRAVLRDSSGQLLEIERRKRRKRSLTGTLTSQAGAVEIDDERFAGYFTGVSEELYAALFGFDLADLQRGAEVLEVAGLGEILGGSALGGSGDAIRRVLAELQAEREDLFKFRGKNPTINRLLDQLRDARAALRDATLQQASYQELEERLARTRGDLEATEKHLVALRQRLVRVQRLVAAAEDFRERRAIDGDLASPAHQSPLTGAEAERARELLARAADLAARARLLADDARQHRERAAALAEDPALAAEAPALERLYRQIDRVARLRRELPAELAAAEIEAGRITADLAALAPEGPPSPSAAPDEPTDEAHRERLRGLVDRWRRAYDAANLAARTCRQQGLDLDAARVDADAGAGADADLLALAAELDAAAAARAELDRGDAELDRLDAELGALLAALDPPLAPPLALAAAAAPPVPSDTSPPLTTTAPPPIASPVPSDTLDPLTTSPVPSDNQPTSSAPPPLAASGDARPATAPKRASRSRRRSADAAASEPASSPPAPPATSPPASTPSGVATAPASTPRSPDPAHLSAPRSPDPQRLAAADAPLPSRPHPRPSADAPEPHHPATAPLADRPLPDPAAVTALDSRRAAATDALARREAERARVDAELDDLLRERAAIAGDLPDRQALAEARAARDAAWMEIRRAWHEGQGKLTKLERYALARSLEDATLSADALADRLLGAASVLTLDGRIADARARLSALDREITEAHAHRIAADRALADLWAPIVGPRPPADPSTWLRDAARARDLDRRRQDLLARLAPLRPRLADLEARLRAAFAAGVHPPPALADLLRRLRDAEREAAARRGRREAARERLAALTEAHQRSEAALALARADEAALAAEIRELLPALGLTPDIDPLTALLRLDRRAEIDARARALAARRAAISVREVELTAFDADARELLQRLALPADADPRLAEARVEELHRRAAGARANALARAHALDAAAARERELAEHDARLTELREHLGALRSAAAAPDDEALAAAAARARARDHLRARAQELDRRLARALGEGDARRELEDELLQGTGDQLLAEHQRLGPSIDALDRRRTALAEQKGKLDQEIEALGGSRAARLSAEIEALVADLGEQVDRYVAVHIAQRLLENVTERYARDNQPAILGYASELCAAITGGRHVRVVPEPEGRTLALVDAFGETRTPKELSTGTREQLFLALRLAYVLDYCDRAEPLPVIMDDVLVNFDAARAHATVEALARVARTTQVLLFTCHRHLVDIVARAAPGATILELPAISAAAPRAHASAVPDLPPPDEQAPA